MNTFFTACVSVVSVKSYANVIGNCIQGASIFNQEVKDGAYPAPENGWSMDERELDKFMNLLEQQY